MSDEERELKIRYAPQRVEIVPCEACECVIDGAFFDSSAEARDFARKHLRDDGRILCGWCADPKQLERLKAAERAAFGREVE